VAGLLIVLVAELFLAIRSDGLTVDEGLYIGAGYRALSGDFRLNPEHPPLAKLLGALPLLGMRPKVPEIRPGETDYRWSYRFVNEANNAALVVGRARLSGVVLMVLGGLALWAWARSTHGRDASLITLLLFVVHPSLLAHGHLVTTDWSTALAMLGVSWAFWRWSGSPGVAWACLVGLVFGLSVATRHTAFLMLPVLGVLCLWLWLKGQLGTIRVALLLATVLIAVPVILWTVYGFRYAPWPGESVAKPPGPWLGERAGKAIAALESARLLPEAYLEGVRFTLEHDAMGHPTYLLGRLSNTGWLHYYLVAFLVKNTPGLLLATAVTLFGVWRRRRLILKGSVELHWLVPSAVTLLVASLARLQLGERYVLPVYPYLLLLAGASLAPLARGRHRWVLVVVLLLHVLPSVGAIRGGYLSYFNFLAGGREGGHRVLLDSNLDWGQDLPRLAAWMRQKGVDRIRLGYHGSDDPDRFGIAHEDLPGAHLYPPHRAAQESSAPVAVSPNMLFGLFYPPEKNPYASYRDRVPSGRAGVFFIYE